MTEKRTLREKLLNRLFAVPAIAQWWARRSAQQTGSVTDLDSAIPFASIGKPLAEARIALVTTAGLHLHEQPPFDMDDPNGDPSFREIPNATPPDGLTITHKYYDHTDADADPNVVFPLERLHELATRGIIGEPSPRHFAFMGHIDGSRIQTLHEQTGPAVAGMLKQDQVDAVLLTPA
jgi:D-proline reductase (dithiol) PrdB